jgi:hypothetical protein
MTNTNTSSAKYTNSSTAALVEDVEQLIQSREELRDSREVAKTFASFKRVCEQPPTIMNYIRGKTDAASPSAGFNHEQLELLMLAVVARSSSTWGTIQAEAALLAMAGEYETAAIVNANAMNETGDKTHRPHSLLLFDSVGVLGDSLHTEALTPARYHMARHIHAIGRSEANGQFADAAAIQEYLHQRRIHIPHTTRDIEVALHFCTISPPDIFDYHTRIAHDVLGLDDMGGRLCVQRDPYNADWKALRMLELAVREASSDDEHDTGRLSYIGGWGLAVDAMLGHVPYDQRTTALAWTRAHNDEMAGRSVGWKGAAEKGHAEDARHIAIDVLKTLDRTAFIQTLDKVTALGKARLAYWNSIVSSLEAKEGKAQNIPLFPTQDIPPGPTKDGLLLPEVETAQLRKQEQVNLVALLDNIDTSTATGRCFLSMIGAIHKMEGELRAEHAFSSLCRI